MPALTKKKMGIAMKKISICAILVIILSLCVACQDNNTKISNEDLAAKFASAFSQTSSPAKPSEATTPVPDTQPTDAIDRPDQVLLTLAEPDGESIESDTIYLDDGTYVESFLFDGATYVQFCRFPGVYDKNAALALVAEFAKVNADEIEATKTKLDLYTAYRLSYIYGSNEDTQQCIDMVVITDNALYLLHTRTYLDSYEMCEDDIESWIEGLYLADEPKQPPYMTASPAMKFDAYSLAGWWVYMGEDADPEVPIVYYFTEDGYVFLWPEAYYDSYAGNEVFCCEWEMREGKPVYLDIDGLGEREAIACDILYEGEDAMSILWPDGVKSFFMRNTTQEASHFLKKGEYDYLAKAPVYCKAYFDEYVDQTTYTILIDDIAYVTPEDTDLIAEYHLEDAPFDNALELYNEDPTLYPMQAFTDGSTVFSTVRMLNGRIIRTQVSAEQFIEFIYPDNLRLFTVTANEGYIEEIAEVYLP